jgi:hypothetical protein
MGVSGKRHVPAALNPRGKDPVPIGQEAGWAPEPVWIQRLEEKSFRLCRGSNLDRPVVQPVSRHYTDSATRPTERRSKYGFYKDASAAFSLCYFCLKSSRLCNNLHQAWYTASVVIIITIMIWFCRLLQIFLAKIKNSVATPKFLVFKVSNCLFNKPSYC